MSPIPLHIVPAQGPFPLINYNLAKPLQLWLLDPERQQKGGQVARRSSI
jgi:hypothetical protein